LLEETWGDDSLFSESLAAVPLHFPEPVPAGRLCYECAEALPAGAMTWGHCPKCGALIGGERRWGYIDRSGETVIRPGYMEARRFSKGLAAVAVGGHWADSDHLWGFIDKTGRMVIPATLKAIDDEGFRHGLARVGLPSPDNKDDEIAAYVDRSGKIVWRETKPPDDDTVD